MGVACWARWELGVQRPLSPVSWLSVVTGRGKFALISIVAVTASTEKGFSPSLLGSRENVCQVLIAVKYYAR